jgi:NAD(P)-dependent dehydrogenase (short-subunit alcohol dehydrogenase family)
MNEFSSYANKRVVVTGCYSGIGHATARLLLNLGAKVHGLDRKQCDLPLHEFTLLDLRDQRSIETAVDRIGEQVYALFNCAGVAPGAPALDVMSVNFIGTRHFTKLLVPRILGGGAIVNVASNGGAGWRTNLPRLLQFVGTASFAEATKWFEDNESGVTAAYSFSKEAIIVWTQAISAELIKRRIRVNCTNPGAVQTPMLEEIERSTPAALIDAVAQPIGRRSSADEQAGPLIFLNSDAASYINGAVVPVDGGFAAAQALRNSSPVSGRK